MGPRAQQCGLAAAAIWLLSVTDGAPASDAGGTTYQTSVRLSLWSSDRAIGDAASVAVAQGWGRVLADVAPNLKLSGEGVFEVRAGDGRGPSARAEVREAFLEWSLDDVRLRVGRQIFSWGRADRIHPTDAAASRDFTALVPSDEEQKRGQGAVRVDVDLGALTLQGYWIPEFRPDRYGADALEHVPSRPENWADQFAVRLEQAGGDVDWSLTYFEGPSRNLQLLPVGEGVERIYPQRRMLGADVATAIGAFTLRAEVARNWVDDGGGGLVSAGPEVFAVAGADYEFSANVYANVQAIYARSPDRARCTAACSPVERQIAGTNNVLAMSTRETEAGVSALVAYQDDYQTQHYELSSAYLTQDEGVLLRGRARFRVDDDLRVEVGADYYAGGRASILGAQEDRSGAFVQVAWGY